MKSVPGADAIPLTHEAESRPDRAKERHKRKEHIEMQPTKREVGKFSFGRHRGAWVSSDTGYGA